AVHGELRSPRVPARADLHSRPTRRSSDLPGSGAAWPAAGAGGAQPGAGVPEGATPWAGTDTNADAGEDRSVPLPQTVFAPQLSEPGDGGAPSGPSAPADAQTALMSGGSQLPPTAVAPALPDPDAGQGTPPPASPPPASAPPQYG